MVSWILCCERCEFYYGDRLLRSFFASSDKSLAGTSWDIVSEFLILEFTGDAVTVDSVVPDGEPEKGTYTKSGDQVLMDFPNLDISLEGSIKRLQDGNCNDQQER